MANMQMTKTPMPEQDPQVRNANFLEVAQGYTLEQAMNEAQRCIHCKNPACVSGCPVGIPIPDFLAKVAEGDIAAAYEGTNYLLDLGHDLKAKRRAGVCAPTMQGKHIVLLFEKTSTRTRCSFEVAATQEGAHVTYLDAGSSQMGKKESLEDSAKVLGRFFDGIEYRGYEQSVVEDLAKWSGVPVWNGLTDADHPTQILADLMTIEEHYKKPLNKIKVVFPGDVRNNMCYAWMMGAAKLGMHFVAMGPEELAKQMDQEVVQSTFAEARKNGGLIEITDHAEDLKGADVIYGDVWASMGEEAQIPERVGLLSPFRVTMDTLKATENPDVLYLHCLPSFHDFETKMAKEWQAKGVDIREVTDEVFRSHHSVVFDEAENRMHSIKAVMVATIGA